MKSKEKLDNIRYCSTQHLGRRGVFSFYIFGIVLFLVSRTQTAALAEESTVRVSSANECEIVSVEGKVWILANGKEPWQAAKTGQLLHVGDRLRTEKASRAALRFSGLSAFRINELTIFEILPPPQSDKKP